MIAVGSTSALKVAAVAAAFPRHAITPLDFPSAVRPQPVGKRETEAGARHRAEQALARCPGAQFGVGIENGMWAADDDEAQGPRVADVRAALAGRLHALASGDGSGGGGGTGLWAEDDPTPSGWLDGACVVVLPAAPGAQDVVQWSDVVGVPMACLLNSLQLSGDWDSGGSGDADVVPVTGNWSALKDPQVVITKGTSRQDFLTATLRRCATLLL